MTELERWMNDHPPLTDALTAEETAALRAKVLARRPKAPGFARLAAGSRGGSALLSGRGRSGAGAFPPHERRQRDERTGAEIRRGAGRTADRRDQRPHGQCKGAAARARTRCGCCTTWTMRKRDGSQTIWCGTPARFTLYVPSGQQRATSGSILQATHEVGPC